MKQVKFTLTTIVLFCTLFLVSSFQSRDNFNAEEIKYNFIYFENMTNESGVIYVFEYLNYYSKIGEYHNSGNRSGYIRLAHSSEDAYEFMLTMLRVAAGQGRTGDGSGLGAARQNPCGEPSRIARSLRRGAPRVGIRPRRRADPHLCFAHRVTRRNGHPDLDHPATMEHLPAAEKLPARKHALK